MDCKPVYGFFAVIFLIGFIVSLTEYITKRDERSLYLDAVVIEENCVGSSAYCYLTLNTSQGICYGMLNNRLELGTSILVKKNEKECDLTPCDCDPYYSGVLAIVFGNLFTLATSSLLCKFHREIIEEQEPTPYPWDV